MFAFMFYFTPYLVFLTYLLFGYHDPRVLLVFWIEQTLVLVGTAVIAPVRLFCLWTIWDMLRLISLTIYLVANRFFPAETYEITIALTLLNFFSWIGVCKFLRRVSGVREFITLIGEALNRMIYFGIIIVIFLVGFATSLRIKPQEANSPDHVGGQSIGQSLMNQYKLVFGDFGPWDDFEDSDIKPDGLDTTFFILITIVVTMILFNLIVSIFSEAYADLKEIKIAVDIEQLNECQCDVEFYVRFAKIILRTVFCCVRRLSAKDKKKDDSAFRTRLMRFSTQHLIYAQY